MNDSSPFKKVKSLFPILKLPMAHEIESYPPKVGEVEVEINCLYDPSLKLQNRRREAKAKQQNQVEGQRSEIPGEGGVPLGRSLRDRAQDGMRTHNDDKFHHQQGRAEIRAIKPSSSNDPLELAIERAEHLRNRIHAAESNKNLPIDVNIEKALYDGTGDEVLKQFPAGPKLKSHEAELARLKLALQSPELHDILPQMENDKKKIEKLGLALEDIEKLKLNISKFVPEHRILADRLQGGVVCLQIRLPKFHDKVIQDSLVFTGEALPEEGPGVFSFHKELKNSYPLKEIGLEKLSKASVYFTAILKIPKLALETAPPQSSASKRTNSKSKPGQKQEPKKAPSTTPSTYTSMEIAKGSLKLADLFNSPNFEYSGRVYLDSLVALDQRRNDFKAGGGANQPTKVVQGKKDGQEDILPKEVAYIDVHATFINDNITIVQPPEVLRPAKEEERPNLHGGSNIVGLSMLAGSKAEFEGRQQDEVKLPICLFVHVIRAAKIPDRGPDIKRNLYVQHKVYGTPDDLTSAVFWNQSEPEIDHRVVLPLTRFNIELMKDAPMSIAVWDKKELPGDESVKDELLGMVRVHLKSVYSLLSPMSDDSIKAMIAQQDLNLLELTHKYLPIEKLVSNHTNGFLKVYVGLGNIRQIHEYNILTPGNNSKLLGIDPETFDFATGDHIDRRRDPKKKRKVMIQERWKQLLDQDPVGLKHLVKTLIEKLNNSEITPERFQHEVKGLMSRHPNPAIVSLLQDINKEAERCNPFEFFDMTRKNYLRLNDPQLFYNKTEMKYYQIFNDGEKVPMDKCVYPNAKNPDILEPIFVDPTVLKVHRNDANLRLLSHKQANKLVKLGQFYEYHTPVEIEEIKAEKQRLKEEKMYQKDKKRREEEEKLKQQRQEALRTKLMNEEMKRRGLEIEKAMIKLDVNRKLDEQKNNQQSNSQNNNTKTQQEVDFKKEEENLPKIEENDEHKNEQIRERHDEYRDEQNIKPGKDARAYKQKSGQSKEAATPTQQVALKHDPTEDVNNKHLEPLHLGDQTPSPSPQVSLSISPRKSSKGWNVLRSNLGHLTENLSRQDETYVDASQLNLSPVTGGIKKRDTYFMSIPKGEEDTLKKSSAKSGSQNAESSPKNSVTSSIGKSKPSNVGMSQFDLYQVGVVMVRPQISMESEDSSEDNLRMKNINLLELSDAEAGYDTTIHIKQFETERAANIQSDDIIHNFTIIMEYMRRFVHENEKIRKNMKFLLLGQFQSQMMKDIAVEDLEYIAETYLVDISPDEIKLVFDFIDSEQKGTVKLSDIHDSLVSYIGLYKKYHSQYEGTFKYLLDKIENQEKGFDQLTEFVAKNSQHFHIDTRVLEKFLHENYFLQDVEYVDAQLKEYGEFMYYDQIYIFNILNMLSFLRAAGTVRCNPQKILSFHSYESFIPLILQKVREICAKVYPENTAEDEIEQYLTKIMGERAPTAMRRLRRNQSITDIDEKKLLDEEGAKLSYDMFSSELNMIGLGDLSIYEKMIIFYFIHDFRGRSRMSINKNQVILISDLDIFFKIVLGTNIEKIQQLLGDKLQGSLASFINREKMFGAVDGSHHSLSMLNKKNKNPLLNRRKMKNELVPTDRMLYRITVNVLGMDDIELSSQHDFGDFSLSFTFPGEELPFESQLFTIVPREKEYEVLLNTEHTFRSPSTIDISEIFAHHSSIRFSLKKVLRARVDEVAYCLVPFTDIITDQPSTRRYFLFPTQGNGIVGSDNVGRLRLAFAFHMAREQLTQKEHFFARKFIVNNNIVEKDAVFEREIPRKGYIEIKLQRIHSFTAFYSLFEVAKRLCRFGIQNKSQTISFLIKVHEIQKPSDDIQVRQLKTIPEERHRRQTNEGESLSESQEGSRQIDGNPDNISSSFGEEDHVQLFHEFGLELKKAEVSNLESVFAFIDTFSSKPFQPIYCLKRVSLELDPEKLSLLESSDMHIGLYFSCESNEGFREELVASSVIPCRVLLTLQNLAGIEQTAKMKHEKESAASCMIDVGLNYSKVYFDEATVKSLNKFKDVEAILDQMKTRELYIDLTEVISVHLNRLKTTDDSVFFVQIRISPNIVQSTGLIDSEGRSPIRKTKLNEKSHMNIITFKLQTLVSHLDINKIYQEYSRNTEGMTVHDFVLGYIPKLQVYLIERHVNGTETETAAIHIEMRHIIKATLEKSPSDLTVDTYKGYIPFDLVETIPEAKDLLNELNSSKTKPVMNTGARRSPQMQPTNRGSIMRDSQVDRTVVASGQLVESMLAVRKEDEKKALRLSKVRLGIKISVINTKLIPKTSSEAFMKLLSQDWIRDPETFLTRVRELGFNTQNALQTLEKGFGTSKTLLASMISKDLGISLIQSNQLVDIIGVDHGSKLSTPLSTEGTIMLYNTFVYPLDFQLSLDVCKTLESLQEDLLMEFSHFDTRNCGYIEYSEAFRLLNNHFEGYNLTIRNIQSFKYSDLMRGLKEGISKQLLRSLDREGFDYIIFLSEIEEVKRKYRLLQKRSSNSGNAIGAFGDTVDASKMIREIENDLKYQLKLPVWGEGSMIDTVPRGHIDQTKDGATNKIQPAVHGSLGKGVFKVRVIIEGGTNMDQLSGEAYPNTFVSVINWYDLDPSTGTGKQSQSQVIQRDPEPQWNLKVELERAHIEDLYNDRDKSFQIDLYSRKISHDRPQNSLFKVDWLGMHKLAFEEILPSEVLSRFLADPLQHQLTYTSQLFIKYSSSCFNLRAEVEKPGAIGHSENRKDQRLHHEERRLGSNAETIARDQLDNSGQLDASIEALEAVKATLKDLYNPDYDLQYDELNIDRNCLARTLQTMEEGKDRGCVPQKPAQETIDGVIKMINNVVDNINSNKEELPSSIHQSKDIILPGLKIPSRRGSVNPFQAPTPSKLLSDSRQHFKRLLELYCKVR